MEINSQIVDTPPIASATVMLLREGNSGSANANGMEVLMMGRHADSGVLGGAHVFPGGKVDAADQGLGAVWSDTTPDACRLALNEPTLPDGMALGLYAAALRETFEESGLVLGAPFSLAGGAADQLRRLMAGERLDFLGALQALGSPWPTSGLLPWSRWVTPRVPSMMSKRFDTRFFVAVAPEHQVAQHCEREATETVWLTPQRALERAWAGEIDLAPPQIMSLAHLARFGSVASVLAWARAHAPVTIEPEPFDEDGERVICYPGDPAHSQPVSPWPGPTRLMFRRGRFDAPGGLAALLA
ncbi:NUDIX hydrolase [Hydrogenophaga sp. PAMC20947]|nr:NUDIX hydrolase [Hydrogenophaga sp. PAMC20947]